MGKYVLWAPRVLMSILIVFIIVMAIDAFRIPYSSGSNAGSLLTSLIPAALLLAGLITGWKHKLAAGIIVVIIGLAMIVLTRIYRQNFSFLVLSTPVLVTGILYFLNWLYDRPSGQNNK